MISMKEMIHVMEILLNGICRHILASNKVLRFIKMQERIQLHPFAQVTSQNTGERRKKVFVPWFTSVKGLVTFSQ